MKASKGQDTGKEKVPGLIQVDQRELRHHLDQMAKNTVEETLNAKLDAEAERLVGADKYKRTEARND